MGKCVFLVSLSKMVVRLGRRTGCLNCPLPVSFTPSPAPLFCGSCSIPLLTTEQEKVHICFYFYYYYNYYLIYLHKNYKVMTKNARKKNGQKKKQNKQSERKNGIQWNLSFGIPPFSHSGDTNFVCIIFVLVTSKTGTPPFRGHFSLS